MDIDKEIIYIYIYIYIIYIYIQYPYIYSHSIHSIYLSIYLSMSIFIILPHATNSHYVCG